MKWEKLLFSILVSFALSLETILLLKSMCCVFAVMQKQQMPEERLSGVFKCDWLDT